MRTVPAPVRARSAVGRARPKLDAVPKSTGAFEFSSDLHVAGMLHGSTVRSPYASALIKRIDVSPALAITGVRAGLTCADVPGRRTFGLEISDQPVLADERVRYFGEAVAIVAAEDPETARRAGEAVVVEYEPLAAITDPEVALASAPLHPDHTPAAYGWRNDPRPNAVRTVLIRHGDPDTDGEVVVSGVYELGMQDQAFLGPESGLVVPDGRGGVDIYVATQWLHQDLDLIAASLDLGTEDVRVHLAGVGGAFGGREDISMQIHGAMLALETGRPVRFVYSREESFVGHVHRHPARIWAEHRARADGTLACVRVRVLLDGGAYASGSPSVAFNAATHAVGPYRIENALIEATTVYTNNPPCGAMRGFGVVQVCHAAEAQMDKLAAALGIDPIDFRLANALAPGDTLPTGDVVTGSLPVAETIRRCASLPVPEPEGFPRDVIRHPGGSGNTTRGEGVRRGVGFAVAYKNMCYSGGYDDSSTARVRLFEAPDTKRVAEVHYAGVEFGQGLTNLLDQVVRAELDVDEVVLAPPTTAGLGSAGSTAASRQAVMSSGALRLCCSEIRAELDRRDGRLDAGEDIDVTQTFHHLPTSPLDPNTGQALGERVHVGYACVAMRAVVEVDVELGLTRVVWIGTAQDVGHAINPVAVEGQIEGGTAQGLGLALMEEILTRDGVIANASFTDYLIPTMLDVSPIDIELVEKPDPDFAYGAKGVGEPPAIVSAAAIAAAVRDATGLELPRIPIRPEHIALAASG